eukprot:TRINITY_DN44680_c0_g1_i1.p1 TRINITY_DN44680_c0_g1~~TRINITY_DN44680_c0_g1_i1.p1  ORF type:complete len:321 (+),score=34.99 TRINITY_DN44680_c0_g1_i1:28-963(+)
MPLWCDVCSRDTVIDGHLILLTALPSSHLADFASALSQRIPSMHQLNSANLHQSLHRAAHIVRDGNSGSPLLHATYPAAAVLREETAIIHNHSPFGSRQKQPPGQRMPVVPAQPPLPTTSVLLHVQPADLVTPKTHVSEAVASLLMYGLLFRTQKSAGPWAVASVTRKQVLQALDRLQRLSSLEKSRAEPLAKVVGNFLFPLLDLEDDSSAAWVVPRFPCDICVDVSRTPMKQAARQVSSHIFLAHRSQRSSCLADLHPLEVHASALLHQQASLMSPAPAALDSMRRQLQAYDATRPLPEPEVPVPALPPS